MFAVADCARECLNWPGTARSSVTVFGELLPYHMEEAYGLVAGREERLSFLATATATAFDGKFGEPAVSGWIEGMRERLFELGY